MKHITLHNKSNTISNFITCLLLTIFCFSTISTAFASSNNNYQWYLYNDKNPSSSIQYPETTSSATATPVVVVADSGIDITHEDLKNQMYSTQMYNAFTNTSEPSYDTDGHGTHIAGVIAATKNKITGSVGISKAKLLAVKCIDDKGQATISSLCAAYRYIISQKEAGINIKAVNLSLSGQSNGNSTLDSLITQAGELGILTICAAGNEGTNTDTSPNYPVCFNNKYIISVGASNSSNQPASFSNYGARTVDIFAPGTDIFSTYNTSIYNPELNHSLYYSSFENANSLSNIYCSSNDSSLSMNSFGFITDTANTDSSLSWSINATKGQTYYISIPYTISDTANQPTYIGMKVLMTSDKSKLYGSSKLTLYHTSNPIMSDCMANELEQYSSVNYTNASDYWTNISLQSSMTDTPQKAGTYYAILCLKAGDNATFHIGVDDFGVGYNTDKYAFLSGSSMATPIITGELVFLVQQYPDISTEELRARVLGGTDTFDSYSNKCSSNGKVNVAKALNNPNPSLSDCEITSSTLTMQGAFLGEQKGTIKIYNATFSKVLPVMTWSSDKVEAAIKNIPSGSYTVSLSRSDSETCQFGQLISYSCPIKVTKLTTSKKTIYMTPKAKYKLKVSISPSNAANKQLQFKSSNKKYATVSKTGVVTSKQKGLNHTVTITCTATDTNSVTLKYKIKIRKLIKNIDFTKKSYQVSAGKKICIKTKVTPKITDQNCLVWKSSNTKYATVSKSGVVTAKKKGKNHKVTITCSSVFSKKIKQTCTVYIE